MLAQIGIDPEILPADIDERVLSGESATQYVQRLAAEKAMKIAQQNPGTLVIGADTTIDLDGEILGKPDNQQHAVEMLTSMAGREHRVHTGIAVVASNDVDSQVVTTRVELATITRQDIENYWRSGEPVGKAGAYAIQGLGAVLVKRINGSYSNVVGLPVCETAAMLMARGYSVLSLNSVSK